MMDDADVWAIWDSRGAYEMRHEMWGRVLGLTPGDVARFENVDLSGFDAVDPAREKEKDMSEEAPTIETIETLIANQTQVVANLQGYAGEGENGSQECREYGMALSSAIDKLATLTTMQNSDKAWSFEQ